MPWAPLPDLPPPTPFWSLGFKFESVARTFGNIGDNIRSVWLLGTHLSAPFDWLEYLFTGLKDIAWDADGFVKDIKRWVDGILYGDTLYYLWKSLNWWFDQFALDPQGFVRDRMISIAPVFSSLIYNATAWFQRKAVESFPFLNDILFNPTSWVRGLLSNLFGWGIDILYNPISYVIDIVTNHIPSLGDFVSNPFGYIQMLLTNHYPFLYGFLVDPMSSVVGWLESYSLDISDIIRNPRYWIRKTFFDAIGIWDEPGYPFWYILLRGLMRRFKNVTGDSFRQLTQLLCDIVMKFM